MIFGVFVFSLYFALLSFVSFLAVSNHGVIGKPGGGSGGVPSIYISHQLIYKVCGAFGCKLSSVEFWVRNSLVGV